MKNQVLVTGLLALFLVSSLSYAQSPKISAKASQKVSRKAPKRVVVPSKEFRVSLELAAVSATLKVEVRGPKKNVSKGFSFEGLANCSPLNLSLSHIEETGKCLDFKAGDSKPVKIPIVVIKASAPKAHEDIVEESAQRVRADKKDWGELDIWKSTKGGFAYYFFLGLEDKDQMVRLGPLPESLQKAFDIQMDLELW